MEYIDGFMQAKRRKQLQPVLAMLVADPEMVSREMIEDVLKFKRLDGVEAALNRIIDDTFAGGRQSLQLTDRLGELTVPVQVDLGPRGPDHPGQPLPKGYRRASPVHVLDGAGHMVHMEKAAEINELIERFVAADERAPRSRGDRPATESREARAPRRRGAVVAVCASNLRRQRRKRGRTRTMTASASAVPQGYHSVTPYLAVDDAAAAIAFYKEAFGAREVMRMPAPGGKIGHAEVEIGGSRVMLADEYPDMGFRSPEGLRRHAGHAAPLRRRRRRRGATGACAAGAREIRPVEDQFYGDRTGTFEDPFGHVWHLATRTKTCRAGRARSGAPEGDAAGRLNVRPARATAPVRRWNDFGRVRCSYCRRESEQPRPESLTPVQASAGSR